MIDDEVLRATREVLVAVARDGGTITYEALLARVDERTRAVLREHIAPVLRAISSAEDEAGRGLLTAVVVRDDTGRPGAGWFELARERGRAHAVDDRNAAWTAELSAVHRAWREA